METAAAAAVKILYQILLIPPKTHTHAGEGGGGAESCRSREGEEKGTLMRPWADAGWATSWWGGGTCLCLSAGSLVSTEGGDRWSPKVPAPVAKMLLQSVPPWPGGEGGGGMRKGPPPTPQGSIAYRAGVAPLACSYNKLSAASTWTPATAAG